jgi:hypothetical protein
MQRRGRPSPSGGSPWDHVHPESVAGLSHYPKGSVPKAADSLREEKMNQYALHCLTIRLGMKADLSTPLPDDVTVLLQQERRSVIDQ